MSELSDLLGGLLGSEAGKDSGGMDGLFDLLGGLMQSAPSQKKEPSPEEPPGAKAPDTADFEQILRIVPSCRMMIRISGCCGRFSRTLPRSGLPGQKMSSR